MKLIKLTDDHYIVVDENIQPVNGLYYDAFVKAIKNTSEAEYGKSSHCWQITHSTQKLYANDFWAIRELKLSEVKELLGVVDVEKKMISPYPMNTQNDVDWCNGHQRGYKQALEDNKDKKYTEDDLRTLISKIRTELVRHNYNHYSVNYNEIIQTLQPKTEWEVEFVDGKLKLK